MSMENHSSSGGSAFPHQFEDIHGHPQWHQSNGMTLRDWFAGQALAGWLASFGPEDAVNEGQCSDFAYRMADAMLAARKEGGK